MLKTKEEVFSCFQAIYLFLENQFNTTIETVRYDNGTEFVNVRMKTFFLKYVYCKSNYLCLYTTTKWSDWKKHRHILKVSRSFLFQYGLPKKFWGDVVLITVFLINRLPSYVLKGKSHFKLVYKHPPIFYNIRVFGYLCFAARFNVTDKFVERYEKCVNWLF